MLSIQDPEQLELMHDIDQSQDWKQRLASHPSLDLAFRSFFLTAVAGSILAISIWLLIFNGWMAADNVGISAITWHVHEMIFGFAATVAVGFLLTAVQTWTSLPSVKGLPILAFILCWLAVRLLLLSSHTAAIYLAIGLQLLWWLGAIYCFSHLVLTSRNRRSYLFIPLLTILMLFNISLLIADVNGRADLALHLARTSVLTFGVLMGVLGGRVIPFFTKIGAKTSNIDTPALLTQLLLITSVAGSLVYFSSSFIELPLSPAILMISAGILHLARQCYWKPHCTLKVPLLWSLHLAYFSLGISMILLGTSYFSSLVSFSSALHLTTIAAMGLMIFAMMSRVSLGHTGRLLNPDKLISILFVCILLSALFRSMPEIFLETLTGWNISAVLWIAACLLFLKIYFPILTKAGQN